MFLRKATHILNRSFIPYQHKALCLFSTEYSKFSPEKDYYLILHLSHHASKHDINDAYAKMANLYYADKDKGIGTRFGEITEAYRVLSDEELKRQYDIARMGEGKYSRQSNFKKRMEDMFHKESPDAEKLTPDEKQYYKKVNKYIGRGILVLVAYFIFSPFFFWQGKAQPPEQIMKDTMYPKRHGGMYFNDFGYNKQLAKRKDGNPLQEPPPTLQQKAWNPPGVIVTGQIVED